MIRPGLDNTLDELRAVDRDCDRFLAQMEQRERERTGIATLKVGYNSVHGFFIEVSRAQADKVPADYRRRQTLKSAERYITAELKTFEDKALSARERALAREKALYEQLLLSLAPHIPALQQLAARDRRRSTAAMHWPQSPSRRAGSARNSPRCPASTSGAAAIRWWRRSSSASSPTIAKWTPSSDCWSSPARTWAASRPTCARSR